MIKKIVLALLACGVVAFLVIMGERNSLKEPKKRVFNHKINYRIDTYNPYDIKFVYETLKSKTKESFDINSKNPDAENQLLKGKNKLFVVFSPHFLPNHSEMDDLCKFVEKGNNVYISAFSLSPEFLDRILEKDSEAKFFDHWPVVPDEKDSLVINWPTKDSLVQTFAYPGVDSPNYNEIFFENSENAYELARDKLRDKASLYKISFGSGSFFVQLRPMSMTNYFLLHKSNYTYLNNILNEMDFENQNVIWDNYYRNHPVLRSEQKSEKPDESYLLDIIKENPSLKWAVLTFLLGILLFLVIYSRRIQAPIKIIPTPQNHSVEFSEALSGLYWLNQENKKIAEKISKQWLDFINTNFRIAINEITLENTKKISQKTNKNQEDIKAIFEYINFTKEVDEISNETLVEFYKAVFKFINN